MVGEVKVRWMGGRSLISQWCGQVVGHSWKDNRSLLTTPGLVRVHDR